MLPPAVADATFDVRTDTSDVTSETEGELELLVDDFERHEVVFFIEATIVEEQCVAVQRRKPET